MVPTIVGQLTLEVETFWRALVAAVAGPVVVGLVHGGHLGEGELRVAELVQLAVVVARVLVAVGLQGVHLLVVGLDICSPKLVVKQADVAGERRKLELLIPRT